MNLLEKEEKKNCLTCKYEPDWEEWDGEEDFSYRKKIGYCKYSPVLPDFPLGLKVVPRQIALFEDHNFIFPSSQCKVWEKKEEK